MKKETRLKLISVALVLAVNILCTYLVLSCGIKTTALKTAGSYISLIVISILSWRFPLRFYIEALIFNIFASTLGSAVNLYTHVSFYDLFVHFLSGVLLAEAGYIIIDRTFKKHNLPKTQSITRLFSLFFSCSCAALWEIYEFTADNLINAQMQGSKENTMWDIIAGVLGAITYYTVTAIIAHQKSK